MIPAAMAVAAVTPWPTGRAGQAHRSRFARLVALIIDSILIAVLSSIATNVYGVTQIVGGEPTTMTGFTHYTAQLTISAIWTTQIWLVYYAVFEGMLSATPGKALNGLRVVSVDGSPLSLRSILIRTALRLIDVLPSMYLLGGALVMTSANSQRVGDRWARTTVVFSRDAIEPRTARSSPFAARLALVLIVLAAIVFTVAFDYFERPALVIQSDYNQHNLLGQRDLIAYSLGQPTRTLDEITYPITARTRSQSCSGSVTLRWEGPLAGWQVSGGELACFPS